MDVKNKRFLVTGGAGFIGSNTVNVLIEGGAEVVVVDNLVTGRRENLNPKAKFYEMNIADPKLEAVFKETNPEYIYHFAFNVLVPKSVENPLVDMDSIAGSVNLFQNAQKYGVKKIIFSSSGFIYGNNPNLPVKEEEPMQPVSPYSVSKYTVENYLRYFSKTYGIPYVIFRYAAVYGPGQVTGAMSDYIRKLASGQQAEIWGDGSKTRDYVYIDDLVWANILALDLPEGNPDPVFNVGTGVETTLNELYWKIAELLGKEPLPKYFPDRPGEQIRYCLDATKAKNILGWQPEYNMEEGLKARLKAEKRI